MHSAEGFWKGFMFWTEFQELKDFWEFWLDEVENSF